MLVVLRTKNAAAFRERGGMSRPRARLKTGKTYGQLGLRTGGLLSRVIQRPSGA